MTTRKLSLLALLLIVPVSLQAQRRGGSGSSSGGGGAPPKSDDCGTASSDAGKDRGFKAGGGASEAKNMINCMKESPSLAKDLQKANPVEILLDAKKDLQLSKDEEKELKTLSDAVKDGVKPFLKTIDSVDREFKKTGDYAPTSGQLTIGRALRRESSDSVMVKYQTAAQDAIAKLAEPHRQPATETLQKAQQDMASKGMRRPPV
jgi:hypothetical protein